MKGVLVLVLVLVKVFVGFVVDAGMTLDFESRVLDAEAVGEHRLQLAGAELRVVQAERTAQHDVRGESGLLAARRP